MPSKSVSKRLQVQLPPGSDKAIEAGCTCPVLDNHHGIGAYDGKERQFWINGDCPIHGGN